MKSSTLRHQVWFCHKENAVHGLHRDVVLHPLYVHLVYVGVAEEVTPGPIEMGLQLFSIPVVLVDHDEIAIPRCINDCVGLVSTRISSMISGTLLLIGTSTASSCPSSSRWRSPAALAHQLYPPDQRSNTCCSYFLVIASSLSRHEVSRGSSSEGDRACSRRTSLLFYGEQRMTASKRLKGTCTTR